MYRKVVFTLLVCFLGLNSVVGQIDSDECSLTLKGKVTDTHDGTDLSYSSIYILELQKGVAADDRGKFSLTNLCQGEYTVIVMHIGCEPDTSIIDLKESMSIKFDLEHHAEELGQTNVFAYREPKKEEVMSAHRMINDNLSSMTSIAALSSTVNGVSMLQSGSNVAKPVIHGLHSNRIIMVNNDVALEGQNWGIEHAPEIDPFSAERLTVVKGASALRYGTSAIGGTIIALPDEPGSLDQLNGQVYLGAASNNRKGLAAFKLNGRFEQFKKWNFGIQGSAKKSGNVKTPRYYLNNTAMEEYNYSWTVGYLNKGFASTVHYSQFNSDIGVFSGAHIGNLTDLETAIASEEPRPEDKGDFSYAIDRPYQHVEHETIQWKNELERERGKWQLVVARQFNLREEYDKHLPRGFTSDESLPEFAINLESYTGSLVYEAKEKNNFQYEAGINAITQINRLRGRRSFIPAYTANGLGAYAALSYDKGYWETNFGARIEQKNYDAEIVEQRQVNNVQKRFLTPAVTAELVYNRFKLIDLGLNYTFSQRAPGINELFSDGIHHGVAAIEYGDESLNPESSQKVSGSLFYKSKNKKTDIDVTIYSNWIADFIYLQPQEAALTIRGAFPVYQQQQTDAFLSGVDLGWNQEITKHLAFDFNGSYLYAQNESENKPLIFMPANRIYGGFVYTFNSSQAFYKPFIQVGLNHVFEQKRVPLDEDFAEAPSAYSLLLLRMGSTMAIGKYNVIIDVTIENLTNTVYRDYMNRFRYYSDEMGRNISVNLRMPFLIKTTNNK